ncbi:response regulator transcription factor [Sphingobacterium corticibacter]|nr:response regulator transcription factor [Sphingobacterium corticibacter]
MEKTRIIIADDHLLFADGLAQIVGAMPEFDIIAQVPNGRVLLQLINTQLPDLILMDINMPIVDGLQAATSIRTYHPNIRVVFISMYKDMKLVEKAKEMGAHAYIMKDTTAPELREILLQIRDGKKVFSCPENDFETQQANEIIDPFLSQFKLTPREVEIIKLIKKGLATKQIAADLDLSTYTIETHRKNINRKLNVQSATELLAFIAQYNKES